MRVLSNLYASCQTASAQLEAEIEGKNEGRVMDEKAAMELVR